MSGSLRNRMLTGARAAPHADADTAVINDQHTFWRMVTHVAQLHSIPDSLLASELLRTGKRGAAVTAGLLHRTARELAAAGHQVAPFVAGPSAEELAAEAAPLKRKRGRPPGSKSAAEQQPPRASWSWGHRPVTQGGRHSLGS